MAEVENLHLVELWTQQSSLFWQTVYRVPIFATAIFVGWYVLHSNEQEVLAVLLLCLGIFTMIVQVAILARMAQYLNVFRDAAGHLIPHVKSPKYRLLTGFRLGIAVPLSIAVFFALLVMAPSHLSKKKSSGASTLPSIAPTTAPKAVVVQPKASADPSTPAAAKLSEKVVTPSGK